jgi:hypothetical protein
MGFRSFVNGGSTAGPASQKGVVGCEIGLTDAEITGAGPSPGPRRVTQARLLGLGNAEQHAVQVVKHGAGRPRKQRPDQPRSSVGAGRG